MALLFQEKKVVFVGQYYNGAYVTPNINKLSVEEVDSFVIPRVLVLKVHCVQHVLDEGHGNHRQQDGILQKSHSAVLHPVKDQLLLTMTAGKV